MYGMKYSKQCNLEHEVTQNELFLEGELSLKLAVLVG